MSQITSHVLDTSKGLPAPGIEVTLFQWNTNNWVELSHKITNKDGRITDLLIDDFLLQTGIYKMKFNTKEYFNLLSLSTFYPYIEIIFEITGKEHYHIPLLLNAYGYSTYRGS